jgi:signal transduction histidine kinase
MNGWAQVVVLAAASAAVVGFVGFSLFRTVARWNVLAATVLAVVTPVVALAAGLVVVGWRMFLSSHDLRVALVVSVAAGAVSVVVGLALARRVQGLEEEAEEERRRSEVERGVESSRRDLVAWVSHDLRTPLAGLRAMAEALEDGVADDPARYHRLIRIEVDRLASRVDDLFQLSRIQAGTLRLSLESVSASDLLSDTVATSAAIATARGIHLQGSAAPGIRLDVDAGEIHRALANLVINAIRHTPPDGSVTLDARLDPDGFAVLAVRDGCRGISADELPHLFDVGWRGTRARSPGPQEGAGLGLAIVRGIVDAHHGSVTVENVAGGCEFAIRLPVAS